MVSLFSTWLLLIQILVIATARLRIRHGSFVYDAGNYLLALDVDKDGNVVLSAEVHGRRPSRSRPFPLIGGTTKFSSLAFSLVTNYTVDASPSIFSRWYRPIRRQLPGARIRRGDLINLGFADSGLTYTRFQGREVVFTWKPHTLVPGLFVYRNPTGDQLQVGCRVHADMSLDINVSCHGLDGVRRTVRASLNLARVPESPARPFVEYSYSRDFDDPSIIFKNELRNTCREVRDLLNSVTFGDENTLYVPIVLPGSVFLPLDRVVS
ncbi:hypothetical protein FOZ60_013158 [Perkinsus olseni]|uniref:Uncharacterized protein n=1 Tax=Perkinsus olseni TaxID=32597 RepID=A0A7J6P8R4_PEROL|nr:hypothetical protein FOZ60_013158 [Perkinsus olseni]